MAQPNFQMLWDSFPDHTDYPTLGTLHQFIGGAVAGMVGTPGFDATLGNTCAMRLSRALNCSNMPIVEKLVNSMKLHTVIGGDHRPYLFREREVAQYLGRALGVHQQTVSKDFGSAFDGKRGIVEYVVTGWDNATGHLALWDGGHFREDDHDDFRLIGTVVRPDGKLWKVLRMKLWPL